MTRHVLFGFHAVTVRLKTAPDSVVEVHLDVQRRDARMRTFAQRATEAGAKVVDSDDATTVVLTASGTADSEAEDDCDVCCCWLDADG